MFLSLVIIIFIITIIIIIIIIITILHFLRLYQHHLTSWQLGTVYSNFRMFNSLHLLSVFDESFILINNNNNNNNNNNDNNNNNNNNNFLVQETISSRDLTIQFVKACRRSWTYCSWLARTFSPPIDSSRNSLTENIWSADSLRKWYGTFLSLIKYKTCLAFSLTLFDFVTIRHSLIEL